MKSEKLNILFCGDVLLFGMSKTSNRSGIFFTADNILKQLVKRNDVNVTLFITHVIHDTVAFKNYVKNEYPGNNLSLIDLFPDNFISRFYARGCEKQNYHKINDNKLSYFYWKIVKNFVRPVHWILLQLRIKNILNKKRRQMPAFKTLMK